jgi:NADPH-dependent curcumin reductase CurA
MKNKQIVLASRPKGTPSEDTFRFEDISLKEIQGDEVLLKGLYYSVDPYMRGRMNDTKSYAPPFELDKPITGGVVAEVIQSGGGKFQKGDLVTGRLPWQKQIVASEKELQKIDDSFAPASYYLSILGMTGLTAYFGLISIGKPKEGETVVVSGAAGAVGMVVGQIAKLKGCRVVGIAGTDEKINMLKEEFGFDEGINYKTAGDLKEAVSAACPDGVDIYFDNVGGEVSDAVLSHINFQARIPLCGQISLYNNTEMATGPRLQPLLLTKSALIQGFIVSDFESEFPEGMKHLSQWVKEEKLKFTETVIEGFDQLPKAMLDLFTGGNTGKMVVKA